MRGMAKLPGLALVLCANVQQVSPEPGPDVLRPHVRVIGDRGHIGGQARNAKRSTPYTANAVEALLRPLFMG